MNNGPIVKSKSIQFNQIRQGTCATVLALLNSRESPKHERLWNIHKCNKGWGPQKGVASKRRPAFVVPQDGICIGAKPRSCDQFLLH